MLADLPVAAQGFDDLGVRGREVDHPHPVLAGRPRAGRRADAGRDHVQARKSVRVELEAGVDQLEPIGLLGHPLALQQADDHVEAFVHLAARVGDVDAEHVRVGGQRARPDAHDVAAAAEVVEQDRPLGYLEGVVVRDRDDPAPELDRRAPLCRGREKDLGGADDLATHRVVLAEEDFVEAHPIEVFDELEISLQLQRRVDVDFVQRDMQHAEASGSLELSHQFPPLGSATSAPMS